MVGIDATLGGLTPAGQPNPAFHSSGQPIGGALLNLGESIPQGEDYSPWEDEFNNITRDNKGNILLGNDDDIVLVGGHMDVANPLVNANTEFLIMALSLSGGVYTEDSNFGGGNGYTTVYFHAQDQSGAVDVANAGLYQPDGTILVSGASATGDIPLARLDLNGNLDQGFKNSSTNQPGTELLSIPGVTNPSIEAMAFQPDGHIILAGSGSVNGQSEALLVRLNSDDTIDDSFGTKGTGAVLIPTLTSANSIAIEPSTGQIVVAGSSLAVVAANGSQFNVTPITGMTASSLAIQSDGKIVLAGGADLSGKILAAVARYSASGTPDSSFGSGPTASGWSRSLF